MILMKLTVSGKRRDSLSKVPVISSEHQRCISVGVNREISQLRVKTYSLRFLDSTPTKSCRDSARNDRGILLCIAAFTLKRQKYTLHYAALGTMCQNLYCTQA